MNHFDRIGARLPTNLERNRGNAVEPGDRSLLLRAIFDAANIANLNGRAINVGNHQLFHFTRIGIAA